MNNLLVIGSRGSKLALTQTELVKTILIKTYPELNIEIKIIKTTGDKILDVPLSKIGDKGLFTKEIEEAMLRNEIDFAVHSMKDLPTGIHEDLEIAAITERENPCDILVSSSAFNLKTLPPKSKVGTSSLRRRAQLLNVRNDLEISDLRGNLDTRIKKLEDKMYDAIIIAFAGVKRLGLNLEMAPIAIDVILPQAGQGALGIQTRKGDTRVNEVVKVLDDAESRLSVEAERTLLAKLEGGCQIPIGVNARIKGDDIIIKAGVFSLNGLIAIRDEIKGAKKDASILGDQLAEKLLDEGAKQILDELN